MLKGILENNSSFNITSNQYNPSSCASNEYPILTLVPLSAPSSKMGTEIIGNVLPEGVFGFIFTSRFPLKSPDLKEIKIDIWILKGGILSGASGPTTVWVKRSMMRIALKTLSFSWSTRSQKSADAKKGPPILFFISFPLLDCIA